MSVIGGQASGGAWHRWALVLLVAAALLAPLGAVARTWTDRDGKTVQGRYLAVKGDKVVIRLAQDGRQTEVPLSELSNADLDYVRRQQDAEARGQAPATPEPGRSAGTARAAAAAPEGPLTTLVQMVPLLHPLTILDLPALLLAGAVGLLSHALFLLLGARLVRLRGGYFEALKATGMALLLVAIVLGFTLGAISMAGPSAALLLFGVVLAGPLAVQVVYNTDFLLAVLAAVVAAALTLLLYLAACFGLPALFP